MRHLSLTLRALVLLPLLAVGADQTRAALLCGPRAESCLRGRELRLEHGRRPRTRALRHRDGAARRTRRRRRAGLRRLWALGTGAVWLSCGAQAALAASRRRGLRTRRRLARPAGARHPRRRRARARAAGRARRRALVRSLHTAAPRLQHPRRDRLAAPPALADGCERRPAAPHARPRAAASPRSSPRGTTHPHSSKGSSCPMLLGGCSPPSARPRCSSPPASPSPPPAAPSPPRPPRPRARRSAASPSTTACSATRRPRSPSPSTSTCSARSAPRRRSRRCPWLIEQLRPHGQGQAAAAHAALHRPGLRARRQRGRGRRAAGQAVAVRGDVLRGPGPGELGLRDRRLPALGREGRRRRRRQGAGRGRTASPRCGARAGRRRRHAARRRRHADLHGREGRRAAEGDRLAASSATRSSRAKALR